MATQNLFKFVAVRPPISAQADDTCRLVNVEAGVRFVEEVADRRRKHEQSLPVARRAVAVAFIESEDYFAHNDIWAELRPLRKQLQDSIAGLCADDGPAVQIDADIGIRFRGWAVDEPDSFLLAKNLLWRSYYANALAPAVRPHDRPEMLDWIRILASLERLGPPPGDSGQRSDAESCACIARLNRARVNMPHELFAETPPADPVPDKPQDPEEKKIAVLRASLGRLAAARSELERLHRRKVARLRLAPPPEPEPGRGDGDSAQRERPQAGAGDLRVVRPPWLLTEEDAEGAADLGTELDRLGIPLAGSLVAEAAEALNQAIAAHTAALTTLESHVDVLGIGPTMTLARRTVRRFIPGPHTAADEVEVAQPAEEASTE
jgi:hypothetical protein